MEIRLNEFEKYLQEEEKSPKTIDNYIPDIRQFIAWLKKEMTDLEQQDIVNYKEHLRNLDLAVDTINRKLTAINQFIVFLRMRGDYIPVKIKRIKKQQQKCLTEVLTKTDYKKLLGVAERSGDRRSVALFKTMYLTGMRISEILQMKIEAAELEEIMVRGKGDKERKVIIPKTLNLSLKEYLKSVNNKTYIFENNSTGKPLSRITMHKDIKYYAGKAKVKLSKAHAHNFRHLFGILCIKERGFSIEDVADALGHESTNTTRIYTRDTQEEKKKAFRDIE